MTKTIMFISLMLNRLGDAKTRTRPNTQYKNMIQDQIRKVVIDPPKTQDLISNKYDIIPNPQSCIWPRQKTLYPIMMMQKQNTNLISKWTYDTQLYLTPHETKRVFNEYILCKVKVEVWMFGQEISMSTLSFSQNGYLVSTTSDSDRMF